MERSGKNYAVPVRRRSKPALIALIAAVIFVLSCVTVCATTPLGENILKALDFSLNQSFSDDDKSYVYGGKSVYYDTLEEFLDEENLEICFPKKFSYDIEISQILSPESKDQTIFVFDDPRIVFEIYHNKELDQTQLETAEIIEFNHYSFYICNSDNTIIAYSEINDDLYILGCDSKDQLIEMIYSFNFERIE